MCGRADRAAATFLSRAGVRLRLRRRPRPRSRQAVRQGRQRPAGCGGAAAGAPVARQQQQPRLRPAALRRPPECLAGRPAPAPADVKSGGQAALYDPAVYRTLFLQFENAPTGRTSWRRSTAPTWRCRPPSIVDGRTYKDVGVHFRGASSFRMVPDGLQAIAEPDLRLRRDEQQRRRLQDAEPAQRATATRPSCAPCSTREIARHYIADAEERTSCAS